MQRACSFRLLERTSPALAHQLLGVTGCAVASEEASAVDSEQSHVSPDGQHSDRGIYKLPGQDPHVVTCLNSPAISSFGADALSRQVTLHGE